MGNKQAKPEDVEKASKLAKQPQVGTGQHWSKFFSGPYFRTIPATRGVHAHQVARDAQVAKEPQGPHDCHDCPEGEDYLAALKRIILSRLDTDGHYGLNNDELVPLPFDAPKAWRYILDFIMGTYQVAQATVVMYIAILVDNDSRSVVLGDSYNKWAILIRVVVSLYPLVTLLSMTLFLCEQLFRKFMYYRLLSMRVLVDWENKKIYKSLFFYYFLATWALLNVWCIYGVVRFWDRGVSSGADTVQFATFIVVNLQTVQLLIQFNKLLTAEKRLVSLNVIFERAPVEAQMLLTYTYVIEESVLMQECAAFGFHATKALRKRLVNLLTCGSREKKWGKKEPDVRFELSRLKAGADNHTMVEGMMQHLKEELYEEGQAAADTHAIKDLAAGNGSPGEDGHHHDKKDKKKDKKEKEKKEEEGGGKVEGGSAAVELPSIHPVIAQGLGAAVPPAGTTGQEEGEVLSWRDRWELRLQALFYRHFYATIHAVYIAIMPSFPTWPYRGDIAYIRMLLVVEFLGICSVAAIIVFGLLRATNSSRCADTNKQCEDCYTAVQQMAGEVCNMTYTIAKAAVTRRSEL